MSKEVCILHDSWDIIVFSLFLVNFDCVICRFTWVYCFSLSL